jgi:hypothetical protein
MGKLFPDVHRELHRVNVLEDVVAIEVSIQGTFLGAFETPAGLIQPKGGQGRHPDRRLLACARRWLTTPGERPVATDLRF